VSNTLEQQVIGWGGVLIDLISAWVIGYHALWALLALARRGGTDKARLIIADGVLAGLGFSVAGTLLKTIALQTWEQLGFFTLIFALRTALKKVFAWERRLIASR